MLEMLLGCTPLYTPPNFDILNDSILYQPGRTEIGCQRAAVGINHKTDTYIVLQINDQLKLLGTGITENDRKAIKSHEPLPLPTARGLFYEELNLEPGTYYVRMCTIEPQEFHNVFGDPGYKRVVGYSLPLEMFEGECADDLLIIK